MTRRSHLLTSAMILATVALLALEGVAKSQASQRDVDALSTATYIYIATVRKDGNQSRPAPVWFTTTPDHIVLLETRPDSWKAKRIRRGSPALIWIGTQDGPAFIGKAEITSDAAVLNRIISDYPQKYMLARIGYARPTQEKFDSGQIVAIKVTPVHDLPDGFTSKPGTPAPSLDHAAPAPAAPNAAPSM